MQSDRRSATPPSAFDDPDTESDLSFGRYAPTTPNCRMVCAYGERGRVAHFEQDTVTGAVYREHTLVWP